MNESSAPDGELDFTGAPPEGADEYGIRSAFPLPGAHEQNPTNKPEAQHDRGGGDIQGPVEGANKDVSQSQDFSEETPLAAGLRRATEERQVEEVGAAFDVNLKAAEETRDRDPVTAPPPPAAAPSSAEEPAPEATTTEISNAARELAAKRSSRTAQRFGDTKDEWRNRPLPEKERMAQGLIDQEAAASSAPEEVAAAAPPGAPKLAADAGLATTEEAGNQPTTALTTPVPPEEVAPTDATAQPIAEPPAEAPAAAASSELPATTPPAVPEAKAPDFEQNARDIAGGNTPVPAKDKLGFAIEHRTVGGGLISKAAFDEASSTEEGRQLIFQTYVDSLGGEQPPKEVLTPSQPAPTRESAPPAEPTSVAREPQPRAAPAATSGSEITPEMAAAAKLHGDTPQQWVARPLRERQEIAAERRRGILAEETRSKQAKQERRGATAPPTSPPPSEPQKTIDVISDPPPDMAARQRIIEQAREKEETAKTYETAKTPADTTSETKGEKLVPPSETAKKAEVAYLSEHHLNQVEAALANQKILRNRKGKPDVGIRDVLRVIGKAGLKNDDKILAALAEAKAAGLIRLEEPKETPTPPGNAKEQALIQELLLKGKKLVKTSAEKAGKASEAVGRGREAIVAPIRIQAEKHPVSRWLFRQGESFLNRFSLADKEKGWYMIG